MRKQTLTSARITGTMGALLDSGAQPVRKQPVRVIPIDDKAAAHLLVAECMDQMRKDASPWNGFAQRIIHGSVEFRSAFITQLGKELKALAQLNCMGEHFTMKEARQNMSTASTMVTAMRAIARGFNAGGTLRGLEVFAGVPAGDAKHLGASIIARYARTLAKSKAGRPAHDYLTKLTTWLDGNAPDDDDDVGLLLRAEVQGICARVRASQVAAL